MKKRCYDTKHQSYNYYGGKGVKICSDWLNNFHNFYYWSLLNGYEEGLSIERKDFDGDYTPDNCCWIPKGDQAKNQSSNNKITIDGVTKNLSDWARESEISRTTLTSRVNKGVTGKELLKPVLNPKKKTEIFIFSGKEMTLKQIAELSNCTKQALRKHLNNGLSIEESVSNVRRNKGE
jgi:hypothetical protein